MFFADTSNDKKRATSNEVGQVVPHGCVRALILLDWPGEPRPIEVVLEDCGGHDYEITFPARFTLALPLNIAPCSPAEGISLLRLKS